jgi:polyisoprenoid-binding protein YceI
MKKIFITLVIIAVAFSNTFAQRYMTKSGHVSFASKTKMENIEANSHQATSIIDAANGEMVFKVLMKSFQFEKALMQEHFNEKYAQSEKYPEATFKGKITNLGEIDFKKDGIYKANVTGDLTMHGVTKPVSTEGAVTISGGKMSASASFPITLKDYNITIPGPVKENIQETVQVKVDATYSAMK